MISMRHEAIAGTIWLGLSLLSMSAGTIISSINPPHLPSMDYVGHTLSIIGLGFMGAWLTLRVTARISRRTYILQMLKSQSGLFQRCEKYLGNPEKADDLWRDLNQIGTLVDVLRLNNEDDVSYLNRLKPYFRENSAGARHPR
jgi:hypothetical protein